MTTKKEESTLKKWKKYLPKIGPAEKEWKKYLPQIDPAEKDPFKKPEYITKKKKEYITKKKKDWIIKKEYPIIGKDY